MTPPARQPQGPAAGCVAAGTHVNVAPRHRDPGLICGPLREAAVTTPAGQQEADGPNIARVYDYLLGGSHNFDPRPGIGRGVARPVARRTRDHDREPGVPGPGGALPGRPRQASASSSTWAPASRPWTTSTRSPSRQPRTPASSTSTWTRSPCCTAAPSWPATTSATAIQADLRSPQTILDHPGLHDLLDLSQPTALLLVAVLHFLPDSPDAPAALVAQLRDALAPGSYVVISHGTTDGQPPHVAEAMEHYAQTTAEFQPRSHAEVLRFFDGLDLIDPGLVPVPQWRPDHPRDAGHAKRIAAYGGAGRKP